MSNPPRKDIFMEEGMFIYDTKKEAEKERP